MADKEIKPRCFNPPDGKVCCGLQGGVECTLKSRCIWVDREKTGPAQTAALPSKRE